MRSSIKDVANKAGVSVATVSHVVNGTRFVSENTRFKVNEAMNDLHYVPNVIARSLRTNKTKAVGLIIPDISNFFFTEIAQAIEEVLRSNGYSLLLCNTNDSLDLEKQQIGLLNSQMVSGMIIAPTTMDYNYRSLFTDSEYPLVFIDRETKQLQGDTVLVDGKKASYEAITCLLERDHKKIGYIMGLKGLSTTNDRFEGYTQAMQTFGIMNYATFVKNGDSKRESGYMLCKELLENHEVSAVFVSNNLMAVGAFQYLSENKIKIPEEAAIIGFDDYNWANITNPPLSTVKQPTAELGRIAANLLLRRMKKKDGIYKIHKLMAEFILRESC